MTTGVIYDQRMGQEHRCLWDSKYNEKPERFACILKRSPFSYLSFHNIFLIILLYDFIDVKSYRSWKDVYPSNQGMLQKKNY